MQAPDDAATGDSAASPLRGGPAGDL